MFPRWLLVPLLCLPTLVLASDTDNDGISDSDEVTIGMDPLVRDQDGDGTWDVADSDMDGDGILNTNECNTGATTAIALVNGGFEEPFCPPYGLCFPTEAQMVGWKTTAPDDTFEVWPRHLGYARLRGRSVR